MSLSSTHTSLAALAALTLAIAPSLAQAPASAPSASDRIVLVLDASGSMTAKLPDGQSRFDAARAAVGDMVDKLPASTSVALRVYGHQSPTADKNCKDTQRVVDFGAASQNASAIRARLGALAARGYTPLAHSIEEAAKDLSASGGAAGGTVILVSDGKETCGIDPCAMAKALAAANAGLVVHTIGFGVDAATRNQLQCIAGAARGTYYDANSRGGLLDQLAKASRQTAAAPPSRAPAMQRTGTLILKGPAGVGTGIAVEDSETGTIVEHFGSISASPAVRVKAGTYRVRFMNGTWNGIVVDGGKTTELAPALFSIGVAARINVELRDPETLEEVMALSMNHSAVTPLIPGRYVLTVRNETFDEIDFKEGAAFQFKPAVITFADTGDYSHTYRVSQQPDGITIDGGPGQDVVVPPGRYTVEQPDKPEAKPIAVDLAAGESRTLTIGK